MEALLMHMLYAVIIILLIIGALLGMFSLYLLYVRSKFANIPGPPLDNFFLGHIPSLKRCYDKDEFAHILFLEWAEKYGPVFKVYTLHIVMLIPTSEAWLKEILTKSRYKKSARIYDRFANICGVRFLGTGLVTNMDHKAWVKRRHAINPAFHRKYLQGMLSRFNQVGDEWIDDLRKVADGKTEIKLADSLVKVTLECIGQVAFDSELGALKSEDNPFPAAIQKLLEVMCIIARDPLYRLKPWYREMCSEGREAVGFLRNFGRRRLESRKRELLAGREVPNDLLTHVLKSADTIKGLSIEDHLDDFDTLFIAGQETTSNVLAFLFGEIGRRPEVLERLREEVSDVLGSRTDLTYADLGKLTYIHQVFQEILRLYPPAPGTARDVPTDVTIDGLTVPAGSVMVVSFYVIHRMETHFKDAEEFRPERFDPNKQRPLFAYLPFSLGQRSCLGRQFAQIETKILVCKFLQNFEFTLNPNQAFDVLETTSLKPRGGTQLTLTQRHLTQH